MGGWGWVWGVQRLLENSIKNLHFLLILVLPILFLQTGLMLEGQRPYTIGFDLSSVLVVIHLVPSDPA